MTVDAITNAVIEQAGAVEAWKALKNAEQKTDAVMKRVRAKRLGALAGAYEIGKALAAEHAAYDAYKKALGGEG